MKIMSVDYGDARTGIAFCDKNEILASAYCTVEEAYLPKLIDKLKKIIDEQKPELVVVGIPRNMDGSYGFRAEKCRRLGEEISEKIGIDVDYEDERLTTVIAQNVLSANNVRGKKRKERVDSVSAVIILQSYIDKRKGN